MEREQKKSILTSPKDQNGPNDHVWGNECAQMLFRRLACDVIGHFQTKTELNKTVIGWNRSGISHSTPKLKKTVTKLMGWWSITV